MFAPIYRTSQNSVILIPITTIIAQSPKAGLFQYRSLTFTALYSIQSPWTFSYTNPFPSVDDKTKLKLNSVAWIRERTIFTERPPLSGEVSANFSWRRVPRGSVDGSLLPYSRISRQEPLLFYQVAPQLYSRGWVDPVPDSLLLRKSGSAGNRNRTSVAKNSDH
jgi:hypothetical protein